MLTTAWGSSESLTGYDSGAPSVDGCVAHRTHRSQSLRKTDRDLVLESASEYDMRDEEACVLCLTHIDQWLRGNTQLASRMLLQHIIHCPGRADGSESLYARHFMRLRRLHKHQPLMTCG